MDKGILLKEIGLTKYECDAYLALLKYDDAEANLIYKEAKVPFGKIYQVLESLSNKGFIEMRSTRPKRYKALNPKKALEEYYKNKQSWWQKKMSSLADTVGSLINEFSTVKIQKKKEYISWTTEVTKEKIMETNNFIYYNPKKSALIIPHENNLINASQIFLDIKESKNKETILKTIMTKKSLDLLLKTEPRFLGLIKTGKIKIRIAKELNSYFGIIDEDIVVLLNAHPEHKEKLMSVVTVWNKEFAKNLEKSFSEIWNSSEEPKI